MIEMSPPSARGSQTAAKAELKARANAKLGSKSNGHDPQEDGDVGKYALTMMADCLNATDLSAEERKEALWMFFDLLLTSIV